MDIVHRVGIAASPSKVFAALATVDGLSGWWTRKTSGDPKLGGTVTFRFDKPTGEEIGGFDMKVLELEPERRVKWQVAAGPQEWVGTAIDFSLSREDDRTVVMFGHRNWRDAADFMAHCSTKWATFLMSLKAFVETGHGRPAPDDVKIDNWN